MSNEKRYYIAYGSNLNVAQMVRRCPEAKPIGTAVLENYILYFKGSGSGYYLTIEQKSGGKVPVAIWEVTPEDEKALDRYEGYPHLYRRETAQVELNGKTVDAMVYIMNSKGVAPPSPFYYDVIRKGYEMNGLDTAVLEQARQESLTKR